MAETAKKARARRSRGCRVMRRSCGGGGFFRNWTSSIAAMTRGADALVRAGPPGPARPCVRRGRPGGRPRARGPAPRNARARSFGNLAVGADAEELAFAGTPDGGARELG